MRIILTAVARSPMLRDGMVIKGGVLLALQYGSSRHTKDVDFSTARSVQPEDPVAITEELDRALAEAGRDVDPEILCRVQSRKLNPSSEDATFPTLRITIGYALQGKKAHQRMMHGRPSADVVTVDISFNETTCIPSTITFDGNSTITAYSLFDQIAEKYRALMQQTSGRRNRIRRQDAYDIYRVIGQDYLSNAEDKATLLDTMARKFEARGVPLHCGGIDEPEVRERAGSEYNQLRYELEEELPEFDTVFGVVRDFYRSLPWRDD